MQDVPNKRQGSIRDLAPVHKMFTNACQKATYMPGPEPLSELDTIGKACTYPDWEYDS